MSTFNALILVFIALSVGGAAIILVLKLLKTSSRNLFTGLLGVFLGLVIGALLSVPLSRLPGVFGNWLPLIMTVITVVASVFLVLSQKETISSAFSGLGHFLSSVRSASHALNYQNEILVDTSVLIDGRLIDIIKSGFIYGKIVVPRFVLQELQLIADKGDRTKRERGRKGLEALEILREKMKMKIEVSDDDTNDFKDVDSKLVAIAKKRNADIITTDYNLNRIAKIQGVKVLNVNELVNAIKTVLLPGEEIRVKLVQAGKERGQGVGYLPDGTMIVVEGGEKSVGDEVPAEVSRVFQTVAGKMIFATLINGNKRNKKNV